MKRRCFGDGIGHELYAQYHDNEWGRPVHDESVLFEFLVLEGTQAGLSWETILNKREGYRRAFYNFDPERVSNMTDAELDRLKENPEIIRNRLKIYSARNNARAFIKIQKEFGSFDKYLWQFVEGKPKINRWAFSSEVPVTTTESDSLSKDLKKRGMSFVGSTIIYAYMQAVGLVNDHHGACFLADK